MSVVEKIRLSEDLGYLFKTVSEFSRENKIPFISTETVLFKLAELYRSQIKSKKKVKDVSLDEKLLEYFNEYPNDIENIYDYANKVYEIFYEGINKLDTLKDINDEDCPFSLKLNRVLVDCSEMMEVVKSESERCITTSMLLVSIVDEIDIHLEDYGKLKNSFTNLNQLKKDIWKALLSDDNTVLATKTLPPVLQKAESFDDFIKNLSETENNFLEEAESENEDKDEESKDEPESNAIKDFSSFLSKIFGIGANFGNNSSSPFVSPNLTSNGAPTIPNSNFEKDYEDFNAAGENVGAVSSKSVDPESNTPFLDQFSYDMTLAAKKRKFDPVIGRKRELEQIIKILSCRKKSNGLLIGEPGTGKTSIIEALAQRIVDEDVPSNLIGKRICSLDLNAIVSGTKHRGEYEERIQGIIEEVLKHKEIIVYIDEFHNLIGNGNPAGGGDGSNILKPYLARGEFQCIGATTGDEYRKYIKDGALKRRFQIVKVDEPNEQDVIKILKGLSPKYEEFHHVRYSADSLKASVEWAGRYIPDRFFPDKAIDLMDTAGALLKLSVINKAVENSSIPKEEVEKLKKEIENLRDEKIKAVYIDHDFDEGQKKLEEQVKVESKLDSILDTIEKEKSLRKNWPEVTRDHIAEVISNISGIPIDSIHHSDFMILKKMKSELQASVIGQDKAIDEVCSSLQRNFLGFRDETKPIGRILMLGKTGCGKTLLAEVIAEKLYGSKNSLIKINMGEYAGDSDINISKLIGSGPGYVGYDDKPILEKVSEKRHSVLLIDEIEKAGSKVWDVFLSILDKGEATLGNGKVVDFRDTLILFTGNLGTKELIIAGSGIGFSKAGTQEEKQERNNNIVMDAVKKSFRPEFINRLGSIVVFNDLGKDELKKIFKLELDKLKARLKKRGYQLKVSNSARDAIIDACDLEYGARDLQREIQKNVEEVICNEVLKQSEENFEKISCISVDYTDSNFVASVNFKN